MTYDSGDKLMVRIVPAILLPRPRRRTPADAGGGVDVSRVTVGMPMPAALPALVDKYAGVAPKPVRFRPATWQQALIRAAPTLEVTALLRDVYLTTPTAAGKASRLHDRTVTRAAVLETCARMDLGDAKDVLRAFVLTMAWGAGVTGNQSLRHTVRALADPARAHRVLSESARTLRAARTLQEGGLEAAYQAWSLPDIGQSSASTWWSFAGHVHGREWQPLILDARVYGTLNKTLGVGGTAKLAGSSRRADRYRAYVETVHRWAVDLRMEGRAVDALRLEFVLFLHNGGTAPTPSLQVSSRST